MSNELGRVLVVSPHLDDGVFGCGELMTAHPGSVVVTVFAGVPPDFDVLTEWDATCGFSSAQQAIAARRAEDRAALELLHAEPCWFNFCDSQYHCATTVEDIAEQLNSAVYEHRPDTMVVPLGLFHSDHRLVHAAVLPILQAERRIKWLAYEDAQYRRIPGMLQQRLAALAGAGIMATPLAYRTYESPQLKQRAVRCYASQLRGLASPGRPGHLDILAPEQYWQLMPGWHGNG